MQLWKTSAAWCTSRECGRRPRSCVRQLVRDGAVKVVWAGSKALINLDDVLEVMRTGTVRQEPEPETVGGIRKVDVRVPKLKRGATYI